MSIIELKSSLGYIWYTLACFSIQIYSHIDNLRLIRYFDSSVEDKSKESSLLLCLILVSITIVVTTILTILNILQGFGNSIEDNQNYLFKTNKKSFSLPLLSLLDIHIAIIILLPKIIIDTQLIKANIKDQSFVFESSIDFLIGNGLKRVKKVDTSLIVMDFPNSFASCRILNFFLVLIRFDFVYSNSFYKLNKCLSMLMSIHSIFTTILSILSFGTFEVLFKEISLLNFSINVYSYLLICSLMLSILLILLTNHSLFHFSILLYSFHEQFRLSNELIRLSHIDDRYIMSRGIRRSLIYYLLFVILSLTCQLPLIILIFRIFLFGLIDNLFVIYLIFLLLFLFISIILFLLLCLSPISSWNFNSIEEEEEDNPCPHFSRLNEDVEEKLFIIESPNLIPSRSVSSCGLTVIDNERLNGSHYHPTFQQTPGVATDALLVMH